MLQCDCLAHRFGNAGDRPYRRPKYPSDMSDAEWTVVREAMPVPGWLEGRGGQPESYCHRQMVDAVRHLGLQAAWFEPANASADGSCEKY